MNIVIQAVDQASQVIENIGKKGAEAGSWLEKNWVAVGAAAAGAGIGLEAMARQQAPLTEQTRKLAAAMGMAEGDVRNLAKSVAGAGDPLNEVLRVMELGRQQGIESAEALKTYAEFWDTVGDATGESAAVLAEAGTALRVMGIAAGEEGEALGALGFVQRETTGTVGEFLQMLQRVGPDLGNMGMSIDDTAAVLGILEREMGLTGRVARTELTQAIQAAEGDMGKLFETLGITSAQFEEYRGKVATSSGVIEENAAIHEESYTIMQRLQHAASELTYGYGDLIGMVGNLSPVLMATGPLLKGLFTAKKYLTKEAIANAKAMTAAKIAMIKSAAGAKIAAAGKLIMAKASGVASIAMKGFGIAMKIALGPIGLIALAIAGLIAIGILLYKNWDKVVAFLGDAWDWLKERISAAWEGIKNFFSGIWEWLKGFFAEWGPAILTIVAPFIGLPLLIWQHWDKIKGWLAGLWDTISTTVSDAWNGIIEFFGTLPGRIWEWLSGIIGRFLEWRNNIVTQAREAVLGLIARFIEHISTFPSRIWTWLLNIIGRFITWRNDIVGRARDAAVSLADGFIHFIRDLPTRVRNILWQVLDRIRDWAGMLWDRAKTAAANLWEGFKRGIGLSSPSYLERAIDAIAERSHRLPEEMAGDFQKLQRLKMPEFAAPQVAMAGAMPAEATAATNAMNITGPLVVVQNMVVRSAEDIENISRQLHRHIQAGVRARGGR